MSRRPAPGGGYTAAATPASIFPLGAAAPEGMLAVAVSPDSTLLAIACRDG